MQGEQREMTRAERRAAAERSRRPRRGSGSRGSTSDAPGTRRAERAGGSHRAQRAPESRSARRTRADRGRRRRIGTRTTLVVVTGLLLASGGVAAAMTGHTPGDSSRDALRALGSTVAGLTRTRVPSDSPVLVSTATAAKSTVAQKDPAAPDASTKRPKTAGDGGDAGAGGGAGSGVRAPAPAPDDLPSSTPAPTRASAAAKKPVPAVAAKPASAPAVPEPVGGAGGATSPSDLCVDYVKGTLTPGSRDYVSLVSAAGGSDLDAWCMDALGGAAGPLAAGAAK